MQDCQAVEQALEHMKVNDIDEGDAEHTLDFLLFLSMEERLQVLEKDCDLNLNVHGLCGVYDLQVINGWKVPLEVQQLGWHVLSYGCWENFGEKRQVLLQMCHLLARNRDAFPLKVPQVEPHGSSHVYYLRVWNGDPFLPEVVHHWRSHGWQDGLFEKLRVHLNADAASVAGEYEWPGALKLKVEWQEENDDLSPLCLLVVSCCDSVGCLEV